MKSNARCIKLSHLFLIVILQFSSFVFAKSNSCESLFKLTSKQNSNTSLSNQQSRLATIFSNLSDTLETLWKKQSDSNLESIVSEIENHPNKSIRATLTALEKNELKITMFVPSSIRENIEENGFQNFHESQVSRGFSEPEGRVAAESSFLNYDHNQYAQLDDSLKPKFALLTTSVFSQRPFIFRANYGDDVFTFKTTSVADQATFTIGDSLNYLSSKEEYIKNQQSRPSKKSWVNGFIHKPDSIFDVYIPFKKFKAIIGLFLHLPENPKSAIQVKSSGETDIRGESRNKLFNVPPHYYDNSYVEIQLWGNIDLSHVESFTFRNKPPTGKFLAALKKHHIKIYDARNLNGKERNLNHFQQDQVKEWDEANESGLYFENFGRSNEGYWVDPKNEASLKDQHETTDAALNSVQSSNGGVWIKDDHNQLWFKKLENQKHQELQSSAEVITSGVYRAFGYNVPETLKVKIDDKYYTLSKFIGELGTSSDLSEENTFSSRTLRILAAYLKDWDRVRNPNNNRLLSSGKVYMLDFGGSLGSRAQGEFKGGHIISEAIGALDSGSEKNILSSFRPRLHNNHPWMKLTKDDYEAMILTIQTRLTDGVLFDIVKKADFSNSEDAKQMFNILKNRRDNLIAELKALSK